MVGTATVHSDAPVMSMKPVLCPYPGILSQNGQITLKVKVNDPHFQYQLRESQEAYLVQICWL